MNLAFRLVISLSLFNSMAFAADDATSENDREKQVNQRLQKLNQTYAEEYVMTIPPSDESLKLVPEPVFSWVNAARVNNPRVQKGAVYIWTRNGRAEVVGTIFSVTRDGETATYYHEFHSLATGPLRATVNRKVQWDTSKPGCKFADFDGVTAPGETPSRRMAEMRSLARKFTGHSINYDDKEWGLNLLPQPLYRMTDSTDEVLDQGVFAMISTAGTDPEVLLVIEARKVNETFQWQYAVCRFTDLKTYISLDNREVWSFTNGTNGPTIDAGPQMPYRFIEVGTVIVSK